MHYTKIILVKIIGVAKLIVREVDDVKKYEIYNTKNKAYQIHGFEQFFTVDLVRFLHKSLDTQHHSIFQYCK